MSILAQRSFAGGELSPALRARVDTAKYATGATTLRNKLIMRHGGTTTRPGTQFVAEVKDSSKQVRLIPFVFNDSQTYILEFGNEYIRFHRDGAPIRLTAQNISGISQANPAVLTYAGDDNYAAGDHVYLSGIVGMTELNNRTFKVGTVTAASNIFNLLHVDGTNVNSTSLTAYASGGTLAEVYELASPYLEADLSALKFVQSADVVIITHPSYAPRSLARSSDTSWSIGAISFTPGISPTGDSGWDTEPASTVVTAWGVTSVSSAGEESTPVYSGSASTPSAGVPIDIDWDVVSAAAYYNVYRRTSGVFGFIGTSRRVLIESISKFHDVGVTPDVTETPPRSLSLFAATNDYPAAVTLIQQRLLMANSNNDPESVWGSRTGFYYNFTSKQPITDDGVIRFTMAGRQVNRVKHLLDLGQLVILTSSGEWVAEGTGGIITPTSINLKQQSAFGSSDLTPIVLGGSALFVQARGSVIRDLGFDYSTEGYRGNDLTIFSAHLFDGYEIVDWTYQQIPHSIVWAVRDDGVLVAMTYVKEHEIRGWHWHDTEGAFENACAIPEGSEDSLYVVVKRTINGATKRYIERMTTRLIGDIVDYIGMDSAISFDGRNTVAINTMTLSGGTTWAYDETLTLTHKTSGVAPAFFASTDVGNEIHLTGSDDELIRFRITGYTSSSVVTGMAHKTVPASLRTTATSDWAEAVDQLSGLNHLEGKDVAILGDGFVVGSPNNSAYDTTYTVTSGSITLDRPYSVIHVGLPYICDLETLDIDSPQGETAANKMKRVNDVTVHLEDSRGGFFGGRCPEEDSKNTDEDPLYRLVEMKQRQDETQDQPVALYTGTKTITIQPSWNSNGRVFIRQVDPLPLSVLAIAPSGMIPVQGG